MLCCLQMEQKTIICAVKKGNGQVRKESPSHSTIAIGDKFLAALAARDFERLETCFAATVQFRALVPSGLIEGINSTQATNWLQCWFDDADEFQILTTSSNQIADRLQIAYRIRVRKRTDWQLIEQQAYCAVHTNLIDAMHLLCSGFRPDPGCERGEQL